MTSTAPLKPKTTLVQTAAGDAIYFGDAVSKFIVAHPKTSVIIAFIVANVLGVFTHL
jgi:hypothetical protein